MFQCYSSSRRLVCPFKGVKKKCNNAYRRQLMIRNLSKWQKSFFSIFLSVPAICSKIKFTNWPRECYTLGIQHWPRGRPGAQTLDQTQDDDLWILYQPQGSKTQVCLCPGDPVYLWCFALSLFPWRRHLKVCSQWNKDRLWKSTNSPQGYRRSSLYMSFGNNFSANFTGFVIEIAGCR